jgi:hypothetical protein
MKRYFRHPAAASSLLAIAVLGLSACGGGGTATPREVYTSAQGGEELQVMSDNEIRWVGGERDGTTWQYRASRDGSGRINELDLTGANGEQQHFHEDDGCLYQDDVGTRFCAPGADQEAGR